MFRLVPLEPCRRSPDPRGLPRIRYVPLLLAATLLLPTTPGSARDGSHAASDTLDSGAVRTALLFTGGYAVVSMAVMSRVWYKDQAWVPFHFFNDNAGYLQVDKFGHAFGAYVESYVAYQWLRRSGVPSRKAGLYGGAVGLLLQTPIELMDGMHEGWGFSWGDVVANTLGSVLVTGQEFLWGEQLVTYKFTYRGADLPEAARGLYGDSRLERLLNDYNGHTYWLSIPLAGLPGTERLPDWVNLAVGYGAEGMLGEFENPRTFENVPLPETERYRQVVVSLDVDWRKIPTASPVLRIILKSLTFVKMPLPAVELTSVRGPQVHWIFY